MTRDQCTGRLSIICAAAAIFAFAVALAPADAATKAIAKNDGKQVTVEFDGKLFARLIYKGQPKPIVYPIIGPHGIEMTRNYPMKKGVAGERADHPHHQSLWYTHGSVNGVDFWAVGKGKGKIINDGGVKVEGGDGGGKPFVTVHSKDKWIAPGDKVTCTDEQTVTFIALPDGERAIDYAVTIHASNGELTFGDTKEGSMGIRTNPKLRINSGAHAVNSEGVTGKPIWGKRAKWVDYSAKIDGHVVGVAIFDHPTNPRHPTWWHAREYGLVAANPFGLHYFERKPVGAGNFTIKAGDKVTFKYRFLFHNGDAETGNIAKRYDAWSK